MTSDDIGFLVKYCNVETGLKILNSQSLRWSTPSLFRDPFELDHLSGPDFDDSSLLKAAIGEAVHLLFGHNEPSGKSNRLIAAIARWREEERFGSEDEASAVLEQLLGQMLTQQQEDIKQFMAAWQSYAQQLRVCCFADKPNNMHNWHKYADNHSGISLRFVAGDDTILAKPRRMTYSTTPPTVTAKKDQVDVMFGRIPAPSQDDFEDKLLTKNKDNSNEREWRCFFSEQQTADQDEQLLYSNKAFPSTELKAVYFGLATAPQDKQAIVKLLKEKFPQTRAYQARALPGRYEIDFDAVATK